MSQETLNIIITVVLVPLAGALIPLLISFINQKTQEIKSKINDQKLNKYIDIAEDAVETAVISTYQTFVEKLKGTDGWTPKVQKQAFDEAKLKAIAIMGTAAREALKAVYDDFDAWLNNKIEAYVNVNK